VSVMPWTAASFQKKHNKGLTTGQSGRAADQANAILRDTGDEGMAIAVANAHAKRPIGHKKGLRKEKTRMAG
jgi:uncharacterized protein YdaT